MKELNFSSSVEETLTSAFGGDLKQAALEALAIEGYRSAKLTAGEVAKVLGLATSIEAQEWLGQHGVSLNYSSDDLNADRASLGKHFPEMTQ